MYRGCGRPHNVGRDLSGCGVRRDQGSKMFHVDTSLCAKCQILGLRMNTEQELIIADVDVYGTVTVKRCRTMRVKPVSFSPTGPWTLVLYDNTRCGLRGGAANARWV